MEIHDIRIFEGSIAIADYHNGLIVMDISFSDTYVVQKFTVHSIMMEMNQISHIYVETKWRSSYVLLTRISPPVYLEISLEDLRNPLFHASYNIPGQNEQYIGTGFVTSNEHYVITMVYSIEVEHPYFFFHQRSGDYMDKTH